MTFEPFLWCSLIARPLKNQVTLHSINLNECAPHSQRIRPCNSATLMVFQCHQRETTVCFRTKRLLTSVVWKHNTKKNRNVLMFNAMALKHRYESSTLVYRVGCLTAVACVLAIVACGLARQQKNLKKLPNLWKLMAKGYHKTFYQILIKSCTYTSMLSFLEYGILHGDVVDRA